LKAGSVPTLAHQSMGTLRHALKEKLVSTGKDMKKDGGVALLEREDRQAADNLFNQLEEYGLFVVRDGELESWLPDLGVSRGLHGSNWLIEAFEKMGSQPSEAGYLKPSEGGVWSFLGRVKSWVENPLRKGIPD
jgi:hypothetical protein